MTLLCGEDGGRGLVLDSYGKTKNEETELQARYINSSRPRPSVSKLLNKYTANYWHATRNFIYYSHATQLYTIYSHATPLLALTLRT
jgi:hypothetical protein